MEFSVVPLGTRDTSVSEFVSKACMEVDKSGLKYILTPMSTIMEADSLDQALEVVKKAHESVVKAGANRVITSIKVDDRRDKQRVMEDKVDIIKTKLCKD